MVVQAPELTTAEPVGFVVAGGRSRRMGRDKARLPWGEATLLDHALARLRGVCPDVRVLCGAEPRYADYGVAEVVDALPDMGPLGGIQAGLAAAGERGGLFLAVDLPLVPMELLRYLTAPRAAYDAVVPVSPRGPEPLCAYYGPRCLEAVTRRLERAERKVAGFWPDVRVLQLDPGQLGQFGDPERLFVNVNAPDDLAAASS